MGRVVTELCFNDKEDSEALNKKCMNETLKMRGITGLFLNDKKDSEALYKKWMNVSENNILFI